MDNFDTAEALDKKLRDMTFQEMWRFVLKHKNDIDIYFDGDTVYGVHKHVYSYDECGTPYRYQFLLGDERWPDDLLNALGITTIDK